MSLILHQRALQLKEKMDDPSCDEKLLDATYKHFHIVNQFLSGWRRIYRHYLRPKLSPGAALLDIGCGGGDVIQKLALWTRQDDLDVSITGIDPDKRALEYTKRRPFPPNVHFYQTTSAELVQEDRRFDVVISNHVLHHLCDEEVYALCQDSERLAKKFVLHNDIRRSSLAYGSFAATKLLFWNSFVTEDGLRSIRRSFTVPELQAVVPEQWRVEPMIPYRNLLIFEKSSS